MENNKKHMTKVWYVSFGIVLVCIAVVALLLFLMYGQTTVSGQYGGTNTQDRLICTSKTTPYPLFDYDNSDHKSMEITATFDDDDLSSLNLIYKLYYDDEKKIEESELVNHAALNTLSQKEELGPDAYEASYSKLKDNLQLSLHVSKNGFGSKALKYFMLDGIGSSPYTQDKLIKAYTAQGFDCESRKK